MMKGQSIPAGFFMVVVLAVSPAYAFDLKDGLSGIQWGEDLSGIEGFVKLHEKGDIVYYANPGQTHTIFNVEAPDVVYGASSGRFFSVYISIETMSIYMELRKNLKQKYGLPDIQTTMKSGETIYKWKYGDIKIKLKAREKKDELKLAFYYTPISNLVDEAQLEDAQDTRYQFLPIDRDKKPRSLPLLVF